MIIKVYSLENRNNTLEYRTPREGESTRNPSLSPVTVAVCYLEEASYLVADQTGCRGGIIFLLSPSLSFFLSFLPSSSSVFLRTRTRHRGARALLVKFLIKIREPKAGREEEGREERRREDPRRVPASPLPLRGFLARRGRVAVGHCDSTQLYPPPPSSPSVVTHVVPLLDYRKHSFITAIKMARFLAESVERPVLLPGKSETRGNSISSVGKWEMAASHFPPLLLLFFFLFFFFTDDIFPRRRDIWDMG